MSYILEALKKADQERDIGAVPDLESTHESVRPKSRSYGWLWIVAPLLIVNGALVAVVLMRQETDVPVTANVPLEQQASVINDQPLQPVQRTQKPRLPVVRESAAPPVIVESPAPASSPQLEISKPVIAASEPVVSPEPVVPPDPEPVVEKRALPREQPATQAVAPPAGADTSQVPDWSELSLEFRSEVTLPRLDVHVYSEDPQRRFILVDLDKYREGETLESGLELIEIQPDGIILSHEGRRFRVEK